MLKGKYEVEMGASSFCEENFANFKRYNKLPQRSPSSLSQFPFICHFISCSQTFPCISAPPLNVTAVFVHLQIIVWVITKDLGNLFSRQAVALGFQLRTVLCCAVLMACYNSKTKNDLVETGRASSSHYVHFLFVRQRIQNSWMLAVHCCKMAIDSP